MTSLLAAGEGAAVSPSRCRLGLLATTLLALSGCAEGTSPGAAAYGGLDYTGVKSVTFNGQKLAPVAALEAVSRSATDVADHVAPSSNPIPGSVRIVVPDYDRLRVLVAQRIKPPVEGAINYYAAQDEINARASAQAVVRGRVFANSAVVQQNDTAMPDAGGADYLLWYQVASVTPNNAGPWTGRWLLKRPGAAAMYAVNSDPGTAVGAPRIGSFIRSVQAAATGGAPTAPGLGIAGSYRYGSGIVLDGQGHILTDNHVIANCPQLHAVAADGSTSTATLAATDASNDLALLTTERRWPAWARFRDSRAIRPGETVVATGFPLGGLVSRDMAVTTGSLTTLAGMQGDTRQLQFSAPIQPGNSGGPLLDDTGRVIGVVFATLSTAGATALAGGAVPQNANFAIKSDTVREFLNANRVSLDEGGVRSSMNAATVGDLARKFTVRVECR